MDQADVRYQAFLRILREELVPAMGCTEPIALAYAAAKAREVLGAIPAKVVVEVSSNIIKNVKSVIVPNTGGLKGIEPAIAFGIIAGRAENELEVISQVDEALRRRALEYLASADIRVRLADTPHNFDIIVTVYNAQEYVKLRITDYHTNITLLEKNGEIILDSAPKNQAADGADERHLLTIEEIIEFADSVAINDVRAILARQIRYNSAIAWEGIKHSYGANVGTVLLKTYPNDVSTRAKALAAAASDARMSGCELPVIINSGSGNQGIAASIPVIVYAQELPVDEEKLYRALVVSNLATIHQKSRIGSLSAFCGAVCAGCGSGAGIAYLHGYGYPEIAQTLINAIAMVSGIICDGAKPSCAAKIAASVEAGILGFRMAQEGQRFQPGDGIVADGVEKTIANMGQVGRIGMRETDKEIINIMLNQC